LEDFVPTLAGSQHRRPLEIWAAYPLIGAVAGRWRPRKHYEAADDKLLPAAYK